MGDIDENSMTIDQSESTFDGYNAVGSLKMFKLAENKRVSVASE